VGYEVERSVLEVYLNSEQVKHAKERAHVSFASSESHFHMDYLSGFHGSDDRNRGRMKIDD
jgi:hypothetical protein